MRARHRDDPPEFQAGEALHRRRERPAWLIRAAASAAARRRSSGRSENRRRRSASRSIRLAASTRLSIAEQQRVEIIKVLVAGARILILDEPTAVLTEGEAQRLLATVREIAERGAAVILVTHKLRDVKAFAHRVTIMRGGKHGRHARSRRTPPPQELTRLMVGSNIVNPEPVVQAGRRTVG